MSRPSWDEYFMEMAHLASKRSTCKRRVVGAVLVNDNQVIATGYNGAPSGIKHCIEIGCLREQLNVPSGERRELCNAVHAEANLIAQAAKRGISSEGAVVYCTTLPCSDCAKLLINAGIKRIFFEGDYGDQRAYEILSEAHIELIHWKGKTNV